MSNLGCNQEGRKEKGRKALLNWLSREHKVAASNNLRRERSESISQLHTSVAVVCCWHESGMVEWYSWSGDLCKWASVFGGSSFVEKCCELCCSCELKSVLFCTCTQGRSGERKKETNSQPSCALGTQASLSSPRCCCAVLTVTVVDRSAIASLVRLSFFLIHIHCWPPLLERLNIHHVQSICG